MMKARSIGSSGCECKSKDKKRARIPDKATTRLGTPLYKPEKELLPPRGSYARPVPSHTIMEKRNCSPRPFNAKMPRVPLLSSMT